MSIGIKGRIIINWLGVVIWFVLILAIVVMANNYRRPSFLNMRSEKK
ncbi:MAG: hypothetical protein M3270_01350 [Thermoproteota archaeon]|nr:hypothetical protein [Thermoproteota archaeon]